MEKIKPFILIIVFASPAGRVQFEVELLTKHVVDMGSKELFM